jgi:hypothetical protein
MRGKLTVYKVQQCGYYARGQSRPACCDLRACLRSLRAWITDAQTTVTKSCAFPGDDEGTHLPVYCLRAAAVGQNDFLITTWNETPSDNGAVGAVDRSAVATAANVQSVDLPENSIPGYATHFWFLADQQRLVTVRLGSQPLNGHAGFNLYMRGYLERFSPHVRWEDDSDDGDIFTKNIIGYALDAESEEADQHLRPRFRSILLRRNSEIAYIRRNRERINKIIRKGRPTTGGQTTRNLLDRALTTLFGAGPAAGNRIRFRHFAHFNKCAMSASFLSHKSLQEKHLWLQASPFLSRHFTRGSATGGASSPVVVGSFATSQAVMPPAISLTSLNPRLCSRLAAIDER